MKTKFFFALVAVAVVLALSACGGKNNANDNASPSTSPSTPASSQAASASASSQAAAGGQTKEVTLTASNWQFDQPEIKVHKGDTIKLTLKNKDGMHSVLIEDLKVEVKNGETKEFTVNDAGTFEFHCNIQCGQGHDNMSGNIIVE